MNRFPLRAMSAGLAALWIAHTAAAGSADLLASRPALRAMLDTVRSELELSDEQTATVRGLIEDRIDRARDVVDRLDDFSFDSVLDLLVEARSIRDDFVPALRGVLDDRQRTKLDELPKSGEIYRQAMVGWIAEERVDKLRARLSLEDRQLGEVREAITEAVRDAVDILEGAHRGEGSRQDILDAVMDLRGTQRRANRQIERLLDEEQRAVFGDVQRGGRR